MQVTAIVDRIEDGDQAVLLVGQEEKEMIVKLSSLPPGVKDGVCLQLVLENDQIVTATIDLEQTNQLTEQSSQKMLLLKQKGRRLKEI